MYNFAFYFNGTNGTPVDGTVDIPVLISKGGCKNPLKTLPFYYTDSFFSSSACSYKHGLARISLGLTMSAFTYKSDGDLHIRNALCAIGCDDRLIETHKFDLKLPTDDSCGCAIGVKHLKSDDTYLVPVVIRSHKYGGEWVSNAHVVDDDIPDHAAGFKKAADGLYMLVTDYIKSRGLENDRVKIWITGYSRGGAVANLLGAKLSSDSGIPKDSIFTYTFATPKTVYDRSSGFYDNIFNIVSELDAVPRMPLKAWGFVRCGTDLYLPCKARRGEDEFALLLSRMQTQFDAIMNSLRLKAHYEPLDDQERVLDLFIDYLDDLLLTPEKYRSDGYQSMLMDYMSSKTEGSSVDLRRFVRFLLRDNEELAEELCSLIEGWDSFNAIEKVQRIGRLPSKRKGGDKTPASEIILMAIGIFIRYGAKLTATKVTGGTQDYYYEQLVKLLVDVYHNGINSMLLMQHWPETYLAWLDSGTESEIFRTTEYIRESIK